MFAFRKLLGTAFGFVCSAMNIVGNKHNISGLSLNTTFENLTDRRYRPYSCGISAPGRNMTVSVTYAL